MNTTTITINWNDYEGYSEAIRTVANSTVNTFEQQTDKFTVVASSYKIRYTPEKQREVMQFFGCLSNPAKTRRWDSERICHIRFLIWRYCYSKFDVKQSDLASISKHNRSSISLGLKKIDDLLVMKNIRQLRDEVYAKCDEVFK